MATEFWVCKTQSHVQLIEIGTDINAIPSGLSRFYVSGSKINVSVSLMSTWHVLKKKKKVYDDILYNNVI